MIKILTIVGARPQFIKAAVLNKHFRESDIFEEVIVHTGQHFDENMSNIFFDEMGIQKPKYNLNINGLGHGSMTGQMLQEIERVLVVEEPDWVLVYGDTNSTLAGALAAKKIHLKVIHVEAGLRSFNMNMPEEINRILTDRLSDLLFCPTEIAINNLKNEGYGKFSGKFYNCGDIMYDATKIFLGHSYAPKEVELPAKFVLTTIHRQENTEDINRLKEIFSWLEKSSRKCKIILPLHPRTKKKLLNSGYDFLKSDILFINPVGYLEMIYLVNNSEFVVTDSGGVQKEAYFLSKYCITLRKETEWVELVNSEYNFLINTGEEFEIKYIELSGNGNILNRKSLYGEGNTGELILSLIKENTIK